jgi:hypothetical protein
MATKADFTEEEWDALQRGVTGAGMYVSLADRDFTDSFGEARALAKYIADNHANSDSALIRDIAGVHSSGFGFKTSPQKLEDDVLGALRESAGILSAKAPEDAGAYRELVLGGAQHVAEAKGGGVSEAEAAAIAKITEALG